MIIIAFKIYPQLIIQSNNIMLKEKMDNSKVSYFALYGGTIVNTTAKLVDPDNVPNSGDEFCEFTIPIKAYPPKFTTPDNYFFINIIDIGKYRWYIENVSYNSFLISGTNNKFSFNTKLSNIVTFNTQYFIWVDVTFRSEYVCNSNDTILLNVGVSSRGNLLDRSSLLKVNIESIENVSSP